MLWVWSYPTVGEGLRDLLMRKCTLDQEEGEGLAFSFGHFSDAWYYLSNFVVGESTKLPKVVSFCVVIVAKDFNPEKYKHLGDIFGRSYLTSGSPVSIVSHYLGVFTRAVVASPPEGCQPFAVKNYDIRKAYVACSLKETIQLFGIEIILVYTALLLKKKVVVYAPGLETVLRVCRTLPQLVWHRQNWNVVYPNVALEDSELSDLGSHSSYVAGFTDAAVEARTDLYDLFVNVPAASLTVAPHSKDSFGMTKIHKDVAMHLMECVEDEEFTDQAVVKELSIKTRELITNLSNLVPEGKKISLDRLHARKMTPATENFLFAVASAEGLAQL